MQIKRKVLDIVYSNSMNANLFFAKKKLDLISKMHCTILLAKTQASNKKPIPEGHDPYVS